MTEQTDRLDRERRHLLEGPATDVVPVGLGTVRFIATCEGDADQVLAKVKSLLVMVDEIAAKHWPTDEAWAHLLPAWFVQRCAPEQTDEKAEQSLRVWRAMTADEQSRCSDIEIWTLSGWIYWLRPENREWYWWDATTTSADTFVIAVEVDSWPFPSGSLRWLLRAAGAIRVDSEE